MALSISHKNALKRAVAIPAGKRNISNVMEALNGSIPFVSLDIDDNGVISIDTGETVIIAHG